MVKTRQSELEQLDLYYKSQDSSIVVLYYPCGTDPFPLLDEYTQDRVCSYYLARAASDRQQRHLWGLELKAKGMSIARWPSYDEILYVIHKGAGNAPLILMIEHFEYLFHEKNDFFAALIRLTQQSKGNGKVVVLLMTDQVVYAQQHMLDEIGDAAQEISGLVRLRDVPFYELLNGPGESSFRTMFLFYGTVGGQTLRLSCFDPHKSYKENICRQLLAPNGLLRIQVQKLLDGQLREPSVYNTILCEMAAGNDKLNDIFHVTGFPRAKIAVYLKNLMQLELVEKVFSYGNTGIRNTRKGVYRIKDPLISFWFRFVYPWESNLKLMPEEKFYDIFISAGLQKHMNRCFAGICKEWILRQNTAGKLPVRIAEYGAWEGKDGNIDFVGQAEDGDTVLGVCAWDRVQTAADLAWLLSCEKKAGLNGKYIYFFSGAGFDTALISIAQQEQGRIRLTGMEELQNE